jgi:cation diffusion facilitator family transporter
MSETHTHTHDYSHSLDHSATGGHIHERKTRLVVYLTAFTMVVEIAFGFYTNSMALLADGFHMSTHAFALGLAWLAYFLSRKYSNHSKFSFSGGKILALSGYTSAIILVIIAVLMAVEAVNRLLNPLVIKFGEAIFVAVIGLIVNAISAVVLHHEEQHADHNIRAAYLHVLADGLTSLTAIVALLGGMIWNIYSLDAISGLLSSVIITKWSIDLIRGAGKELIEFVRKETEP